MIFKNLRSNIDTSDATFDEIYPPSIQETAAFHFSPVAVSILASRYLATSKNAHILDIGSGAGKFCMVGASCSDGQFTGIEHRASFTTLSTKISLQYQLQNVHFVCDNIVNIDFRDYTGFYLFNPFYENMCIPERVNDEVLLHRTLYDTYTTYVKGQLAIMPVGTKLATYFSYMTEIPPSYQCVERLCDDKLKFWVKTI